MLRDYKCLCIANTLVVVLLSIPTHQTQAITINCGDDEEPKPSYDPDGIILMSYGQAAASLWKDYVPSSSTYVFPPAGS